MSDGPTNTDLNYDAVLFDFSGTLFRLTERDDWFADLHDAAGNPIDGALQAELMRRMTAPTGIPAELDDESTDAWYRRDLDPTLHRTAYLAILRASGLTVPGHAESLYARVADPESWQPYPDAGEVLTLLSELDVAVGVVSNIAFDLREVFALHGWDHLVGAWALSHEVGIIKPDAGIFTAALDVLGVSGDRTLMVGDSVEADGGARAVGCAFAHVEPLPTSERPDGLLGAVASLAII
ncbi:HAD family hydrolase [Williamsia sp.]|uniref:HAD family hydrolase n=1 Tax=Williamsia sp. TaxID=1872085 RepID=UPI001A1FD450|nr:HAD family hydrolase [Williamsia sp.]MBJ7290657.1 HAD hydrolase-like protein [Williamsia sp.]